MWHVRQRETRARIVAGIVATLLTLGAAAAILGPFDGSLLAFRSSLVRGVAATYERIVYVVSPQPQATRTSVQAPPSVATKQPIPTTPDEVQSPGQRPSEAGRGEALPNDARSPAPGNTASASARLGPIWAPSAITSPSRTRAADPSNFVAGLPPREFVRRALALKPTQEQQDSIGREKARLYARAQSEMRPVAIPLGGASISMPLFSRGKSREERRRDSIVNADILRRFDRLAVRIREKADSTRRADSIASLKVIATDSMDE